MLRSLLMMSLLALPAVARAQEDDKPRERSAKSRSDDRLDMLEEKLQSLLKEIQALRAEKKETGADREKRALTLKLDAEKKARDKAEAEKKDGGPRVRLNIDGKTIELNPDMLRKLGVAELEKLKLAGVDADMFKKKLAAAELEMRRATELDADMLKKKLAAAEIELQKAAQLKLADLEKLKGAALNAADLEKLKLMQHKLAEEARQLAGAEKKGQAGENKRVIIDAGTGKILRTEEFPGTAHGRVTNTYTVGGGDSDTVHLTRVTYSLGTQQARALDEFLKAFAKARVLETKIDGDRLVVTTTPDVQATIGQVVGLMTGKPAAGTRTVTGTTTVVPSSRSTLNIPTVRSIPVKPAKPTKDKDKDDDEE
jgi:hypothetical protein